MAPPQLVDGSAESAASPDSGRKPNIRAFLALLAPYKLLLAASFAAACGESLVDLLEPWPLKIVLDNVVQSRPLAAWLRGFLSLEGTDKLTVLKLAALAALAIAALGALCSYAEKHFITAVAQWITHDLRKTLYFHIQRMSLSYHDQTSTGDLISRLTSDIDSVQSFITSGLLGALVNVLTLFGMIGVMFYLNWRFTLIALAIAPLLFIVVFRFTRRIKKLSRDVRKKEGQIVSIIEEVFTSIRVVKAFAREEYEQRRLEEESLETVEAALKARNLKATLTPIVEIIVACGTSLVLWFGARMVLDGSLSSGSLVVFIFYLGKMYKPMQELSKTTDSYSKAAVGYERIREVLDSTPDVRDRRGAKVAPRFKGRIELENVTFGYEPDRPILKNFNLSIEPEQTVALVGPTGSGKSTIISLIARFYDPTSGTVKIDHSDVRVFKQRSLRDQISIVAQESILFHGPIWKNIAYGKPGAQRVEILRAAKMANVDEFVEKLPNGYDTVVGERGVTLSGGQRQRVSIARAIIRNTPILLLDEPSSGLDAASEELVFEALDRLMQGKTSIVIAHRLSTIRRADVIFVMKDGAIVEHGNHEELLKAGGLYAELSELQLATGTESPKHPAKPSRNR
jgi:ATP-binding cassette, subfamily B, bacterial